MPHNILFFILFVLKSLIVEFLVERRIFFNYFFQQIWFQFYCSETGVILGYKCTYLASS